MSYLSLRQKVELLAAPATEQVEWLDQSFSLVTGGGSAEGYGNDELLDGYFEDVVALNHLVEIGQVTKTEAESMLRLEDFIAEMSKGNDEFFERDALFSDRRWEDIRVVAKEVLAELPNKSNDPEWMKKFFGGKSEKPIA